MSLTHKIIHGLFIGCMIIACQMDEPESIIKDGLDDLVFTCYDSSSMYFFRGKFIDDSICLYSRHNNCMEFFGQGTGFVTIHPFFTLGELQSQKGKTYIDFGMLQTVSVGGHSGIDEIEILTSPLDIGPSLDSMVRAFLTPGLHHFRTKVNDDSISVDGFEVLMSKLYFNPNHDPNHRKLSFSSALGDQPGNHVEIIEIELNEAGSHIQGHVHVKFECKMYLNNAGDLTGDYVGVFSGELNIPISYNR